MSKKLLGILITAIALFLALEMKVYSFIPVILALLLVYPICFLLDEIIAKTKRTDE